MTDDTSANSKRRADIDNLLEVSGLRGTPVREDVLRLLWTAKLPLTHEQIAGSKGMEEADRVTLYRTLTTLQKAGLVHRVQGKDGVWHFCAHMPLADKCPANHAHFLCVRCGAMRCLTDQSIPFVAVGRGELVTGKQLVASGLCSSCASEERGSSTKS